MLMFRRHLVRILAIVAGAALLYLGAIRPVAVDQLKKRLLPRTSRAAAAAGTLAGIRLARDNYEEVVPWLDSFDRDAELFVLAAANAHLAGDRIGAVRLYERAARMEGRPEIYLYLAQTESELGLEQRAIGHMARAFAFAPSRAAEVTDSDLKTKALAEAQRLRNPTAAN